LAAARPASPADDTGADAIGAGLLLLLLLATPELGRVARGSSSDRLGGMTQAAAARSMSAAARPRERGADWNKAE